MKSGGRSELSGDFLELVDEYCSGLIDESGFHRLEAFLLSSDTARRHFVAYFHHHTELQFAVRAGRAADAALGQLSFAHERSAKVPSPAQSGRGVIWLRWGVPVAAAALLMLAGFAAVRFGRPIPGQARRLGTSSTGSIAWLVNAQDCRWAGKEQKPSRDMRAGKFLRLETGLAEIEFDTGARVILQGPAGLELVSGSSARLRYGTLTARVPLSALGFTILSPGGKVVDLGTEFGLSVDDRGKTTLRVFRGEVEAFPLVADPVGDHGVTVHQDQRAQIDGRTVALQAAATSADDSKYVRAIVPPPLRKPRTLELDFTRPVPGTLLDVEGRGIGLAHRLRGTGTELPDRDPNLRLRPDRHALELTTTRSDLNTQDHLATGEYLGVRLGELGFTGKEDFEISATIPNIPGLKEVGQFGLYAGSRSDSNIRGGLISRGALGGSSMPDVFRLFLVNNHEGNDTDIYEVGLMTTGDDLRLTLRRLAGHYSLLVDNLTRKSSSTLEIAHPSFLDKERELYVGLLRNTQSDLRKILTIRKLKVTVWTTQGDNPTIAQSGPRR